MANIFRLHPARKSNKPGRCKALPGRMVTLRTSGVVLSDTCSMLCVEHAAVLTTALEQSTDSTKVTFTLDGVPTGMEDEIRRNLEGY
jgi:hypothetical protein